MLEHILIVDPDPSTQESLALGLSSAGTRLSAASDAQEALSALSRAEPDAILCDVSVRGIDGFELVPQLRRAAPGVAIVLLGEASRAELTAQTLRRGAYDFLAKPIDESDLALTLARAHERQRIRRAHGLLQRDMDRAQGDQPIVAASDAMIDLLETMERAASFKAPALLTGAPGTGKEVLARAIHAQSTRRDSPFIAVDCVVEGDPRMLSSALFGGRVGADDTRTRRGLLADAHGGTIFLNEIGALADNVQRQLLRLLEEEEIQGVGESKSRRLDVRILAATRANLDEEVDAGRFLPELLRRLGNIRVEVPALADRRADIPLLVDHFLAHTRSKLGGRVRGISDDALERLSDYGWPGNVRELQNVIERASMLARSDRITVHDLPGNILSATSQAEERSGGDFSLKRSRQAFEAEMIRRALRATGGNRTHAARLLEISHRALLYKIKDYGIVDA